MTAPQDRLRDALDEPEPTADQDVRDPDPSASTPLCCGQSSAASVGETIAVTLLRPSPETSANWRMDAPAS